MSVTHAPTTMVEVVPQRTGTVIYIRKDGEVTFDLLEDMVESPYIYFFKLLKAAPIYKGI